MQKVKQIKKQQAAQKKVAPSKQAIVEKKRKREDIKSDLMEEPVEKVAKIEQQVEAPKSEEKKICKCRFMQQTS